MSLPGAQYLRHILEEVDYLVEHSRWRRSRPVPERRNASPRLRPEPGDHRRGRKESSVRVSRTAPRHRVACHGWDERPAHPRLLRRRLRSGLGRRGQQSTPPGSADPRPPGGDRLHLVPATPRRRPRHAPGARPPAHQRSLGDVREPPAGLADPGDRDAALPQTPLDRGAG